MEDLSKVTAPPKLVWVSERLSLPQSCGRKVVVSGIMLQLLSDICYLSALTIPVQGGRLR